MTTETHGSVTVYQKIAAVMLEMSTRGISKDRKNQQQGYSFRGIDDVYNALAPILSANRLVILPRIVSHAQVERQSAKGGALFYTTITVDFDFVSADDGSKHTITTIGEAMDSADKSSNKAQSAAMKYACLLAFCIPTEALPDTDADFTTHDVMAKAAADDASRAKWLAGWLDAIEGVHSSGELKRVIADALADAQKYKDADAEARFVAAGEAKVAKAKAAAKMKESA